MQLFSEGKSYKLYEGSMLDMLEVIEPNSIDAIVTDPPYELGFMNKGWDNSGIAFQKATWEKCLQVLKPGGYLLSFGGSRTFHRIACAIEDAGFEIRDTIMYLYGTGFPKSMNIGLAIDKKNGVESEIVGYADTTMPDFVDAGSKNTVNKVGFNDGESAKRIQQPIYKVQNEWQGWGTTLKPAYEAIIVSRKPLEGSCIDNVLKYGVGGINIDECRIGTEERTYKGAGASPQKLDNHEHGDTGVGMLDGRGTDLEFTVNGRYPSNVILTYDDSDYDEVCGGMPVGGQNGSLNKEYKTTNQVYGDYKKPKQPFQAYTDEGSAARYFYCAKASNRDRDEGLDCFDVGQCTGGGGGIGDYLTDVNSCSGKFGSEKAPHRNTHPCVKPTSLMQYLVRLVTPKGGTVLDPFNGSGSTGKAVAYENFDRDADYKYVGIELSDEYLAISDARIKFVENKPKQFKLF